MRDPKRIDRILRLIKKIWKKHPDYRLGQLLSNHTRFGQTDDDGTPRSIFNYEDDDIIKDLELWVGLFDEVKHMKKTGKPRCHICKKDFKQLSEYEWKYDCEHDTGLRISIG